MSANRTFVIVGASLAGAKAAETLRAEGFEGRIVVVGAEPYPPYERPPLSKEYLRAEAERDTVFVHPEGFYTARDIDLRTATTATAVDSAASEVVLDGGERLGFDRLLLATGAAPRRLPIAGAELEGVLYLRNLGDADAIRERLDRGGRIVVVGAGWIGAEVAASARQRGLEVTILHRGSAPLERVLGGEVGAFYRDLHADQGVELHASTEPAAFEGGRSVERVVTREGRRIDCDLVCVGIGVLPRTELAAGAGIPVDEGILVDERLETGVPGIFAAGDAARARHPLYENRLRVEHWANALHQGPVAARNMLGRGVPYDRVPYFFSDQYEVAMEYSGHATGWDRVLFRGDPATREFIAFWLAEDRVVAGMNVGIGGVIEHIEELVRRRPPVEDRRLADPDVPLEQVARARTRPDRSRLRQRVANGLSFPRRFLAGRLAKGHPTPVSALAPGEGRVVQLAGDKVAVHRDQAGELHALSPVCTHLGCLVAWNGADRTWDCPCHGSRFAHDGKVVKGPAKRELGQVEVSREATP